MLDGAEQEKYGHFGDAAICYDNAMMTAMNNADRVNASIARGRALDKAHASVRDFIDARSPGNQDHDTGDSDQFDVDEYVTALTWLCQFVSDNPGCIVYRAVTELASGLSPAFAGDIVDLAVGAGFIKLIANGPKTQLYPVAMWFPQ
jgi:hypothetical protein